LGWVEHVDDDHAAAMAGGAFDQRRAGDFLVVISVVPSLFAGQRLWHGKQLPAAGKLLVGKRSVRSACR
jgi:hypothetical protein